MSSFRLYFDLGVQHILSKDASDHLLFLLLLCAAFNWRSWKKLIAVVTAFTIGHALTLVATSLSTIPYPKDWVEFLIAVSVLLMAIYNLWHFFKRNHPQKHLYLLVLAFGLIHGMGFSSYFQALLGNRADVLFPLFSFNLGVEVAQLIVVSAIFALQFLIGKLLPAFTKRYWLPFISGVGLLFSLVLVVKNIP